MRVRWLTGIVLLLGSVLVGGQARAQGPVAPGAPLPTDAPLMRAGGDTVTPKALMGKKGAVFLTWQPSCPWVGRYAGRVRALASDAQSQGVRVVLVNPADRPAPGNPPATYVKDPGGTFARALGATRTPQAFLFTGNATLAYVGAIDDSPSGPDRVQTPYLRNAIEAVVGGSTVPAARKKALGCALSFE